MVSTPSARSAAMRSPAIFSANSNDAPEAAVAALDLVIVHRVAGRRAGLARAVDGQTRVLDRELDLFARQAGQLGGDDVGVAGLVDVDRRGPRVGMVAREALQPLLPRAQIAQGIAGHVEAIVPPRCLRCAHGPRSLGASRLRPMPSSATRPGRSTRPRVPASAC